MDKTNDDMLWNGGEGDGNVRSESERDEGTDYEDRQWLLLVKVGRIWQALCIKSIKLIVKYFFLANPSIFSFGRHLLFGGSSITVILHSGKYINIKQKWLWNIRMPE